MTLAGLLYLGAGLFAAPLVLRAPPTGSAVRASWRKVAVAVVAGGAAGPILLMLGLQRTDAASASILLNLELVFTVVLARWVFREHLGDRVVAGAALVAVGGAVLVWRPGSSMSTGAVLVVLACLCWGIDNGVTAEIDGIAPEAVVLAKGLVAGLVNMGIGIMAFGGASELIAGKTAAALAVGAFGYGWSIVLWVRAAHDLGAARAQVVFAAAPFLGAVVAWLVLGEAVTRGQGVAFALAAVGVAVATRSAHRHAHTHEAIEHDHEHAHPDAHHDHDHPGGFVGTHRHPHAHAVLTHEHRHFPDLHHRHDHAG